MLLLATLSAAFALNQGDVVVFYGDSITQQQLYTTYVEAFVHGRFPQLNVRFYCRGWSGETALGGEGGESQERVDRDVKPLNPSVVTVLLGMNDGGFAPYDPKTFNSFNEGYGRLLDSLHSAAPGARLTLIRTSPWDDFAHRHGPYSSGSTRPWQGYNNVLAQYGAVIQAWANKDNDAFVDFNQPVANMLSAAAEDNPDLAKEIIADSIHPGPAGHILMAGALLKAWGATAVVSAVVADAGSKEITESKNCTVTGFNGTSWTETDGSLPFCAEPNDKTVALALGHSTFTQDLNQETLKVQHLQPGSYTLSIDGAVVSRFTSDRLSEGVNLAEFPTPMRKQSLKLLGLATRRSQVDTLKWRQVEIGEAGLRATTEASKALGRLEEELFSLEMSAAQPVRHKFLLTKSGADED